MMLFHSYQQRGQNLVQNAYLECHSFEIVLNRTFNGCLLIAILIIYWLLLTFTNQNWHTSLLTMTVTWMSWSMTPQSCAFLGLHIRSISQAINSRDIYWFISDTFVTMTSKWLISYVVLLNWLSLTWMTHIHKHHGLFLLLAEYSLLTNVLTI